MCVLFCCVVFQWICGFCVVVDLKAVLRGTLFASASQREDDYLTSLAAWLKAYKLACFLRLQCTENSKKFTCWGSHFAVWEFSHSKVESPDWNRSQIHNRPMPTPSLKPEKHWENADLHQAALLPTYCDFHPLHSQTERQTDSQTDRQKDAVTSSLGRGNKSHIFYHLKATTECSDFAVTWSPFLTVCHMWIDLTFIPCWFIVRHTNKVKILQENMKNHNLKLWGPAKMLLLLKIVSTLPLKWICWSYVDTKNTHTQITQWDWCQQQWSLPTMVQCIKIPTSQYCSSLGLIVHTVTWWQRH